MRKTTAFLILLLSASAPALHAAEIEDPGPLRKLQRGFLNVALSPMEISNEMAKEKKRDTFPPSWGLGAVRGIFFMFGRVITGAVELLTFPIPVPSGYAPILEPEFPYQHLDKNTAEDSAAKK